MVSTTSSTSTPTPTPTPAATTASVTKSAAQSILTSMNAGSGIDISTVVPGLVQAQFAAKNAALAARNTALTAQISATSTLRSTISNFSTALANLSAGGTLQTQPVSSSSAVGASAIPGAKVGQVSSSISITALASAQGTRSAKIADRTATIATGSFTLTLGTPTYSADGTAMTAFAPNSGSGASVSINVTDGSLDGIASAINAAKAGVTATVITDADGKSVLSLKGSTGAAQGFTLKADDTASALNQFNVGVNTGTLTSTAGNAKLTVDGVAVQRASNTISDLISGVKLQLNAVTTSPASLTSTRPTSALTQAVSDFVDTYNQVFASVKSLTDPVNGDLKNDTAAANLMRTLQSLTTKGLVSADGSGGPTTLAQLGVGTNRDGTLKVDTTVLNRVLAASPDQVEAMFAGTSSNALGLASTMAGISLAASSSLYGLGASADRYTKAQKDLATQQDKVTQQSEAMNTRLTQQFSAMNSKVGFYKSTQTFLENQIKAWNKSE